ncbi:MAG TPA: hypothetical protein VEJ45_08250 [Candidatus Acidoferrales bacterium]|nr:hypothetical protein [Candidatus Acidoferrales bacterium]
MSATLVYQLEHDDGGMTPFGGVLPKGMGQSRRMHSVFNTSVIR